MLPFVSLLPPHFTLCLLPWPLHLPTPTSLSQSGVYHSGSIRAPYLDADLSFLCTATGERKILSPCFLASLPFLCKHVHADTHTFAYLFLSAMKGQQCLLCRWAAEARRLEGSKPTPAASISRHTANLLPAGSLCLPAADSSSSSSQSCLKNPGLEETGRSSYCSGTSLCIHLACSKRQSLPVIMNYL